MPSQEYFDRFPPFPSNESVAELPRLSYEKLVAGDAGAKESLCSISKDCGFFLLDFRDSPDYEPLVKDVETAFEVSRAWHALDLEQKKGYELSPGNVGYKPMGTFPMRDGKRDLAEVTSFSRSHVLGITESKIPPYFEEYQPVFKRLIKRLHSVGLELLNQLDDFLGLPSGYLETYHDISKPSDSVLRFVHNPPQTSAEKQASLMGHTDNGSLTILFNVLGGLQILPPGAKDEDENWRWVRPEPGCAVVNIGDSLTQWTGGVCRSNIHRVSFAPGEQGAYDRYSFGYFLKPNINSNMLRLEVGDVIPRDTTGQDKLHNDMFYQDWHQRKTKSLAEGGNPIAPPSQMVKA